MSESTGWEAHLRRALEELAGDHRSGAAELASSAASQFARIVKGLPERELAAACRRWAGGILEAQPSMAPFIHLASRILEAGHRAGWKKAAIEARLRSIQEDFQAIPGRVADSALRVLEGARRVLTYSRSSTVLGALRRAGEAGAGPEVILSESRPALEGVEAARELLEHGLKVCLTVDAALASQVPEADVVLIGGDALGCSGLWNKIGTRCIVAEARAAPVPVYALCGSEKWVPDPYEARIRNPVRDPGEVLTDPPPGLEVRNVTFDRTPLEWLTGVVSERGIHEPPEVLEQLEKMGRSALCLLAELE